MDTHADHDLSIPSQTVLTLSPPHQQPSNGPSALVANNDRNISSSSVEMDDLSHSTRPYTQLNHGSNDNLAGQDALTESKRPVAGEIQDKTQTCTANSASNPHTDPLAPASTSPNALAPEQITSAIGPATDRPVLTQTLTSGPQLIITLLLHTGARHPWKISEEYLKKRDVKVADGNPINMSVYSLKELIWRDWRDDWEARPSSPSSIRLIHYGKMLDDKSYLKDGRFAIGEAPHVVHMTIKPQEVVDDEDARIAKGGGRDRDSSERSPGCRCVIL